MARAHARGPRPVGDVPGRSSPARDAGRPRARGVILASMPGGLGTLGRALLALGALLAAVGGLLLVAERVPWLRLGRLPGDLSVERDGLRVYLPLGTSILLSILLTLVLWLLRRRG